MNCARKVFNLKFESKIFEYEETMQMQLILFYFPKNDRTRVHYRDNFPDIRITFLLLEIQLYIVEYSSNILRVETDGSHHHICAVGNKICPCTMAWATHSDRKTWLHLWYHKTYIRSLSENALEPTQLLFLILNSYLL